MGRKAMPKCVATPVLSHTRRAQSCLDGPLHILLGDMMPSRLSRKRINRKLLSRKKILPDKVGGGVPVFSIERIRQINFAVTALEVIDVQLLHGADLQSQPLL